MTTTILVRLSFVVAFAVLCAAPARAQLGPIEPVIISNAKPSATLANLPDMQDDYVVPVEVTVAADGSVTDVIVSTPVAEEAANTAAIAFMKEKQFLPALDAQAQPVEGKASGSVEIHSKTRSKQMRASMKPPNIPNEVEHVRKLTCKDFLWEIERLRGASAGTDVSREIMPWVSLRVYLLDKKLPKDSEAKYLEKWPQALKEAEQSCKATPDRLYFKDTLVLILESLAPNH